jgi:hypothetical protein
MTSIARLANVALNELVGFRPSLAVIKRADVYDDQNPWFPKTFNKGKISMA